MIFEGQFHPTFLPDSFTHLGLRLTGRQHRHSHARSGPYAVDVGFDVGSAGRGFVEGFGVVQVNLGQPKQVPRLHAGAVGEQVYTFVDVFFQVVPRLGRVCDTPTIASARKAFHVAAFVGSIIQDDVQP